MLTVKVSVPRLAELPEAETSIDTVPEVEIEAEAAKVTSELDILYMAMDVKIVILAKNSDFLFKNIVFMTFDFNV